MITLESPKFIQNSDFQETHCLPIPPLWFQFQQVMEACISAPFRTKPFSCFISRLPNLAHPMFPVKMLPLPASCPGTHTLPPVLLCETPQGKKRKRTSPAPTLSLTLPCSYCIGTTYEGVQSLLWRQTLQHPNKGMKQVLSSAFL